MPIAGQRLCGNVLKGLHFACRRLPHGFPNPWRRPPNLPRMIPRQHPLLRNQLCRQPPTMLPLQLSHARRRKVSTAASHFNNTVSHLSKTLSTKESRSSLPVIAILVPHRHEGAILVLRHYHHVD